MSKKLQTRTASIIFAFIVSLLVFSTAWSAQESKEGSNSSDQSVTETVWVKVTPNESEGATIWRAKFAKGDHFGRLGGSGVLATLSSDRQFDPYWNLRKFSSKWKSNDVFVGYGGDWHRDLQMHYPGYHAVEGSKLPENRRDIAFPLDVIHSPVALGLSTSLMRFRSRIESDGVVFYSTYSTSDGLGANGHPSFRDLASYKGLADAPALTQGLPPLGRLLAVRVYSGSDERAFLDVRRFNSKTVTFDALGTYQPEGFPYVSKPKWITSQSFAVIRAKSLSENKDQFVDAEVVLVTLSPSGEMLTEVIESGTYPVETACDALVWNRSQGALVVLREQNGKRQARIYSNLGSPKANWAQSETPFFSSLAGVWESSTTFGAVIDSKLYRLGLDATFWAPEGKPASIKVGDGPVRGVRNLPGFPTRGFVAFGEVGDDTTNYDFSSDFAIYDDNDDLSSITAICDSAGLKSQFVSAEWISQNCLAAKRSAAVGKRLRSIVSAYEVDLHVKSDEVSKAKSQIVEYYFDHPRKGEMLRTEDDQGSEWIIRTYNGDKAWLGDDTSKSMIDDKGDTSEKMKLRLALRRLILMSSVASIGPEAFVAQGREEIRIPKDGGMVDCCVFAVNLGEGMGRALCWFDVKGEGHPLKKIRIMFELGKGKAQQLDLYLKDWKDLEELASRDLRQYDPLRIPGEVLAYSPGTDEHRATLRFLSDISRPTHPKGVVRSGFNALYLDEEDFGKSYKITE